MKKKNYPLYKSYEYANVREVVEQVADRYPDRIAFSYRKKPSEKTPLRISFPAFREDVRALGTEFAARGLGGKHCALIGKLSYHWICTYFALLSTGAVLVPLDKEWTREDLAKTVHYAECEYLFCDSSLGEKAQEILRVSGIAAPVYLDAVRDGETLFDWMAQGKKKLYAGDMAYFDAPIDPMALSMIYFTSGTTGKGKGVMLSQNALMAELYSGLQLIELSPKTIAVLPPHHTFGSNVGIFAHYAAGCEVFLSDGLRYILKEMREEKPEHLTLVPLFIETFYRKILSTAKDQGKDKLLLRMMKASNAMRKLGLDARRSVFQSVLATFGGKLRFIVSGGAPISQEIIDTFDALGITIINGYGITECAPLIAVNRPALTIPASVGFPLACDKIRIRHPDEKGEGEICVKGPNVMLGYFKDPEATAQAIDRDGYFHTGDIGKLERGVLYITGRLKNLIILSNGKNVYPEEIESDLSAIPGVLEIIVYEGKSRRGSEHDTIVAEIYPDTEYLQKIRVSDAKAYFQKAVDSYNRSAVPYKKIGLLKIREEEFPKNTLRKILRFQLDTSID